MARPGPENSKPPASSPRPVPTRETDFGATRVPAECRSGRVSVGIHPRRGQRGSGADSPSSSAATESDVEENRLPRDPQGSHGLGPLSPGETLSRIRHRRGRLQEGHRTALQCLRYVLERTGVTEPPPHPNRPPLPKPLQRLLECSCRRLKLHGYFFVPHPVGSSLLKTG